MRRQCNFHPKLIKLGGVIAQDNKINIIPLGKGNLIFVVQTPATVIFGKTK